MRDPNSAANSEGLDSAFGNHPANGLLAHLESTRQSRDAEILLTDSAVAGLPIAHCFTHSRCRCRDVELDHSINDASKSFHASGHIAEDFALGSGNNKDQGLSALFLVPCISQNCGIAAVR